MKGQCRRPAEKKTDRRTETEKAEENSQSPLQLPTPSPAPHSCHWAISAHFRGWGGRERCEGGRSLGRQTDRAGHCKGQCRAIGKAKAVLRVERPVWSSAKGLNGTKKAGECKRAEGGEEARGRRHQWSWERDSCQGFCILTTWSPKAPSYRTET